MTARIIETENCIAEGCDWLVRQEPRFARVIDASGLPPLRRRPTGFGQLLNAIVAQQISVAAAAGIWTRIEEAQATTPAAILALDDEALRALGLSRPKMRYARALANAQIDFDALSTLPDDEAIKQLTAITGIGQWTAEIYLMFSLGRADVLCAGDLALQESARNLFDLPARPKPKELALMAQNWSPWRGVAARLLWKWYRVAKDREGVI